MWTALDVFIGLTLCYALISLFCTAVQEFFSQFFNARGRMLSDSLKVIGLGALEQVLRQNSLRNPRKLFSGLVSGAETKDLNDADDRYRSALSGGFPNPFMLVWRWWQARRALFDFSPDKIATAILTGKVVGEQGQSKSFMPDLPEGEDIDTLIKRLEESELPAGLIAQLKLLGKDSLQSIEDVKEAVENWVDDFLREVEEWTNRRAQVYSLFIGLAVAVSLNVDTIAIAQSLADDPAKRAAVVEIAEKINDDGELEYCPVPSLEDPSPAQELTLKQASEGVTQCLDAIEEAYPFPIGWDTDADFTREDILGSLKEAAAAVFEQIDPTKIAGLLLTGLALSLGSRYWFDLLKNLLALRAGRMGTRPQGQSNAA